MPAVLPNVKAWRPFDLDAVGLLTLLGVNTLQKSLGRLVQHPWAESFPLLAGHAIPDNLIFEPISGFNLYNITDGIHVFGVNAWFARWLLSQELTKCATVFNIEVGKFRKRKNARDLVNDASGFIVHGFLIAFSVLLLDWYAMATSIALTISTTTRVVVLRLCRDTLNQQTKLAEQRDVPVKVFVSLPTGETVTIYTTSGIVIHCLIAETIPSNHSLHQAMRITGWIAFGIFIITLGMACLAMQMIITVLMLASTFIMIKKWGCDDNIVGDHLKIDTSLLEGSQHMTRTFAALQLNTTEEQAMVDWNWFPMKSNTVWWDRYRQFCKEYDNDPTISPSQVRLDTYAAIPAIVEVVASPTTGVGQALSLQIPSFEQHQNLQGNAGEHLRDSHSTL